MFRRLFKSLILKPSVDDEVDEFARFRIPENEAILTPTGAFAPTYPLSKCVRSYEGKRVIFRRIDGHPDLHDYLWNRAGASIPRECCWVIQAKAAFANPDTNIIFAIADGTHKLQIRMSKKHVAAFSEYVSDTVDDAFNNCWIRSQLRTNDDRAMLAIAYADAKITQKVIE